MQLDDSDFAYEPALLSHMHQQIQVKTTNVAPDSEEVLNIHKGKSKILKYNTEHQANHIGWRSSGTGGNFYISGQH